MTDAPRLWIERPLPPLTTIRVAIVEDQKDIRDGLCALVGGTQGYHCVGAFRSMEDALQGLRADSTDVVLVDIGLPRMSGIEGTRALRARHPQIQVLILTIYDDDRRIFEAVCAGACGYLLKKTPPARLLECIRDVAGGGAAMSPEVARRVMALFRQIQPPQHVDYHLTPHELRLLRMLVEGHNYKTAADALDVSVNTISFHMRSIYGKLEVHSKSEAVAKALRGGLV
jgi:DNA-binding NarL/FixJ family response regulator